MVAITDNIFTRKPHDESRNSNNSLGAMPVTPTSSDCLSVSGDSSCGSVASLPPACPIRRDPALLLERLESCVARRRMGKRKRRRATNEAALAVLVEGYEEDSHLFARPFRSAFTQLFESQDKMTLWMHFMNMSEEHQEQYLAGAEQRARLLNRSLPCPAPPSSSSIVPAPGPRDAGRGVADTRSIHPAALPNDVPPLVRVREPSSAIGVVSDPVLGPNLHNDHFAPPPRPNHLPFAVADPPASLPAGDQLLDHIRLTTDLDEYFSHSYHTGSSGFSHSTPKKDSEPRVVEPESRPEPAEVRDLWATRKEPNALAKTIGDALYEEAEDTATSASSSFEIIDPEEDLDS